MSQGRSYFELAAEKLTGMKRDEALEKRVERYGYLIERLRRQPCGKLNVDELLFLAGQVQGYSNDRSVELLDKLEAMAVRLGCS